MAKILLVDGNSLTYRAFFALPPDMATASGQVTNAVFGFTSMLINVLKDHRPDGMLVAFDRPEPTFRHVADPEYKANRDAAPDILRQQMGLVREVLDSLGIKQVELAGWEADDLIAAATAGLVERGDDVVIVTGDRDSYQLVADPHVKVLYNRRGVSDYAMYDEAGILEKTGVTPALYPQYAALRGDTSDNLPGVPGVGEKTAAKLINTYGGLDGIFANVEQQTPKLRASLTEHEERVRKNLEMMVLSADAPLDGVDLGELAIVPKPDEVKRLFEFLEFRTFADRLAEALGDAKVALAVGAERQELHAEITVVESAADAVELIGFAGGARRDAGVDRRARAAARSPDSRSSPTAHRGGGRVDPWRAGRRRFGGRDRGRPRQRPQSQRQAADAVAARSRPRPDRAAARHDDRRLPHRPGRGEVRARRPRREVHGVRAPRRRRGRGGPARSRRQRARRVAVGRARGTRRAPRRRADRRPPSRRRA